MTLWCIARSPLMWGGDPLSSSAHSISYLQNPEVLAVNASSTGNRQSFRESDRACWIATDPETGDYFVALFNLGDTEQQVRLELEHEAIRGRFAMRDLWLREPVGTVTKEVAATLAPHGAAFFRLSAIE
jgi:hypothetical protein